MNALNRIPREEGWRALYNGGSAAVMKAAVGTIGQIAVYDQVLKKFSVYTCIYSTNIIDPSR